MKQQVLIADRYQLDTTIGRGAMGEVWRAYDRMLGRPVAVKILLAQNADPTADSRFRLEAQTAGLLHHPHVVGVLDFGEHADRLFLVMELVEGDSLARVLADGGPLAAERVADIAAHAAAGLAVAHEQGIVHRDIKPGNLLLDADGTLKIGDFGIARFMDDPSGALTATGQIVGTSLYIAPERALGKPAGPASDVYSLGCVLYQLLTGRPPFRADTAIGILHQHLDSAPVPPRELGVALPPAFENYLLGLLAKRPEDRPTARQTADWFAAGAWRGRPEPLPAAAPEPRQVPAAAEPPSLPRPQTGPPTTYKLPSAPGVPGRRAAHRQRPSTGTYRDRPHMATHRDRASVGGRRERPSIRALVARSPRTVGWIAAAALFLAAMLVSMAVFSPDSSSAQTPQGTRSSPAAPTP
ncbi:hypothetical protein GCM10022206_67740 [Streptomyces chiangmaiensis]